MLREDSGCGSRSCRSDRRRRLGSDLSGRRGHGLLHGALDAEVGLLELVGRDVLLLEDLEGLGNLGLDGAARSALDLVGHLGRRDRLLARVQVRLEVGAGLVLGREVLVGVLVPNER